MQLSLPFRITVAAAALIALPLTLFAQKASSATSTVAGGQNAPATISVDSRLVNIPVVVRDNKGALVQNLAKTDFTLQVDGKVQTIRYFDLDSNLPLTLGLLVDTSQSLRNEIDDERTASTAFLDQMLTGKQDQAFVIQFAHAVELLQDVTASRPKLQAALRQLDATAPAGGGSSTNDPNDSTDSSANRRARGAGTTLYDAVFLASDELMSKQQGRKALVVLTDGDDRGSKERLTDAIEKAQRSDTIVYAIYFKGEEQHQGSGGDRGGGGHRGGIGFPGGGGGGYPGGGGGYPGGGGGGGGRGGRSGGGQPEQRVDGRKVLERMTGETGGRMFEVSKKETVADIFAEIGKELRSQYRLGYTPDADGAAEGYHKIGLAFTSSDKKKFTIQTRDGYYAGK